MAIINLMRKKGVSPLIASVLLIAVTMAIAGVMATWATQFTSTKISETSSGADCIGALDLSSLVFQNTTVSLKIRNVAERMNLTNIKASLDYTNAAMSKEINIKDYGATDPLSPGQSTWLVYDTNSTSRPTKVDIIASNCIKYPATLKF